MEQDVMTAMRDRFLKEQFSETRSDANVTKLCDIAGFGLQLTKLRSAVLWRELVLDTPEFQVRKAPKHLVACMLIEVLLDGENELVVRGQLYDQVLAFCRPFISTVKYPMMNFIRGGTFKIQNPVRD